MLLILQSCYGGVNSAGQGDVSFYAVRFNMLYTPAIHLHCEFTIHTDRVDW